jgi:hypothetical protein
VTSRSSLVFWLNCIAGFPAMAMILVVGGGLLSELAENFGDYVSSARARLSACCDRARACCRTGPRGAQAAAAGVGKAGEGGNNFKVEPAGQQPKQQQELVALGGDAAACAV